MQLKFVPDLKSFSDQFHIQFHIQVISNPSFSPPTLAALALQSVSLSWRRPCQLHLCLEFSRFPYQDIGNSSNVTKRRVLSPLFPAVSSQSHPKLHCYPGSVQEKSTEENEDVFARGSFCILPEFSRSGGPRDGWSGWGRRSERSSTLGSAELLSRASALSYLEGSLVSSKH